MRALFKKIHIYILFLMCIVISYSRDIFEYLNSPRFIAPRWPLAIKRYESVLNIRNSSQQEAPDIQIRERQIRDFDNTMTLAQREGFHERINMN